MTLTESMLAVKRASRSLATLTDAQRQALLLALAQTLRDRMSDIIAANAEDRQHMAENDPRYDRLLLDRARIESLANDVVRVATLTSPLAQCLETRTRPNGLVLHKITVPLGVIGVIYEARPNVTIDVFSLCFKSGNACILKGGKEAYQSNQVLVSCVQTVLEAHGIDRHSVLLLPVDRDATLALLHAHFIVDVCIPRGSQALIDFVRANARVPVIETGAGIVHIYFDHEGDLDKGRRIIDNAKTRRVSVCNALDCVVIHEDRLRDLPALVQPLQEKNVDIFSDPASYQALTTHYPAKRLHRADAADYGKEFLDYKMAIKTVRTMEEAIAHITQYTSSHSEAIITENQRTANDFANHIDAAVIYINASTAFTDGGEFGMGAEIGISTQKLHARGPMGLNALTSYKWIAYGNGQIRQ